ncbi:MAG: toprim domain-containing protein [Candidatus Paceibacterota bacterium]
MNTVEKLTEIFKSFPGIGPRQAKRFVYYLLSRNEGFLDEFLTLTKELKKEIKLCQECFRYFPKDSHNSNQCEICRSPNRNVSSLMIVSRDVDFENIEKSHSFDGKYFVLGGSVPILDKTPENKIRLKELKKEIENKSQKGLREIILGLNANPDGEYTGHFVTDAIAPLINQYNLKISYLGRGLSTGTELEYSDADTIKSALENRK